MYKLVKIYDVIVKNGFVTSAKVKFICDLKRITRGHILYKIKNHGVILPNFSTYDKLDEEGNDYWNILVWEMDKEGNYVYPVNHIYELSNDDGSHVEICIDGSEHDIRVNSFAAAVCSGFVPDNKIEKVRKNNCIL